MKLRSLTLACLLASLSLGLQAQPLTVIHAAPPCKWAGTGKALECGQQFSSTDKLDLGGKQGKVVVWSEKDGLQLLAAQKLASNSWKTTGTAKDLLQPSPSQAGATYQEGFAGLEDLVAHFAGRNYLILDKTWLLAAPSFHLDGDTVLFFKFDSPKANIQVSRKVEHNGRDSLFLDPQFILDMNGRPVPADDATGFRLYWLDLKTKGYKELAKFEFVFGDTATLTQEVGVLLSQLAAPEYAGRRQAIVAQFLTLAHGSPDPHNLTQWLAQRFPEVKL